MAKSIYKKVVKEEYEKPEGHQWEYLLSVSDELTMKLIEIKKVGGNNVYTFEYIEEYSPLGHKSTRYKSTMPMKHEHLVHNISKGIFKPINSVK